MGSEMCIRDRAGVTQILDDAALESILADLRNQKATRGGLYFGEEHFIYDPGKSSEAFAWAREFELDTHGIWAVNPESVSYTHLRAHETPAPLVCRLLLEKKNDSIRTTGRR